MTTESTTVSIAIQIEPFVMKTGVQFAGDVQALAEQMTHYVATNLSQRFTEQHEDAGLFVVVSVKRGDDHGGYEYREGHFVKTSEETPSPVLDQSTELSDE